MAYTPKLTYKGRPLVRCGNDIYYGSMKEPFVVYLQVLSTKKENGVDVADKVHIVLLSTDESKPLPERIARQANHVVFYLDLTRTSRGHYEAEFKLITDEPQKMPEFEITDIYFRMLEQTINRHPEYWLWTHNRWKRTREKFNLRFEVINGKVHEKETY